MADTVRLTQKMLLSNIAACNERLQAAGIDRKIVCQRKDKRLAIFYRTLNAHDPLHLIACGGSPSTLSDKAKIYTLNQLLIAATGRAELYRMRYYREEYQAVANK